MLREAETVVSEVKWCCEVFYESACVSGGPWKLRKSLGRAYRARWRRRSGAAGGFKLDAMNAYLGRSLSLASPELLRLRMRMIGLFVRACCLLCKRF